MDRSRAVSYGELARAYAVMFDATRTKIQNSRTCLMKYLDGIPLPLMIHQISYEHGSVWDEINPDTLRKLEALLGPHGHTIAKAWLVNQE